ncbi:MAG: hypothetical protein MZV63_46185 [Marinilabiliales bacterium]|nr:hypothetical protein [Marinilabiliales bacterium]
MAEECPNKCAYCCNHALAIITSGKYVRYRSPQNIIEEIEHIIKNNPKIEEIFLECETLSINLDYSLKLLIDIEKFNNSLFKPIRFGANFSMVKSFSKIDFFLSI